MNIEDDKKLKMRRRSGEDPTRRIIAAADIAEAQIDSLLARIRYVGSGHHKRRPADYGFERTNPRPTKSLCDLDRMIKIAEAQLLLEAGVKKGMVSTFTGDALPKYVWSVSELGEVFEAKTHPNTPGEYHGYPLEVADDMRTRVIDAWKQR